MYQVLLVDDESIILSGIKFLIDWEKVDCTIMNTARNGQEALEIIRKTPPDIILCDINMPVLDGIGLLKQVTEEFPNIVVSMLTNLEDFDLACQALRHRAADYIIKTQLDPAVLEKSMRKACQEVENRSTLAKANLMKQCQTQNKQTLIRTSLSHFLQSTSEQSLRQSITLFRDSDMLHNYGFVYIPLDFSELPTFKQFTQEEENRLFLWQTEITEQIAKNFFSHFIVLPLNFQNNVLAMFCWDNDVMGWNHKIELFATRLNSASNTVTHVCTHVLSTRCFSDASEVETARSEFVALKDHYYNSGTTFMIAKGLVPCAHSPLALSGVIEQLSIKLMTKDANAALALLEKAMNKLKTTPHRQGQAAWLCHELYDTAAGAVTKLFPQENRSNLFQNQDLVLKEINHLVTRAAVIEWIQTLSNEIAFLFEQSPSKKCNFLEKACIYIDENLDKRISLQDVASHISISPNYLSSLFKKQYNQSLVDYINNAKITKAKEYLEANNYLIYEISNRLGFENAYYFTKVFKKHTGMTPTEYQYQQVKKEPAEQPE